MTRTEAKSELNILPLAVATFVASALAGVAVIVSANAQIPSYPQMQAIESSSTLNRLQAELAADRLKQNALAALRNTPNSNTSMPTLSMTTVSSTLVSSNIVDQQINVNTFLLATRMNNESQLAELQMQAWIGAVDARHFTNTSDSAPTDATAKNSTSYAGVGFPHIETGDRAAAVQYKPYKQLMSISSTAHGGMVPNVKCMGLSAESVAERAKKYDAKIFELAIKHQVSASLVKAVVAKESCYNPKARSSVGAIGLMQLMPETARWLKVRNPENVSQNLSAGVRYLAQLRKRFGSNELALAAYNAGPGNVERYSGIPPFAETENYVQDVMYFYRGYVATTRFVNALNHYE